MNKCLGCGANITEEVKFCPYCGLAFKKVNEDDGAFLMKVNSFYFVSGRGFIVSGVVEAETKLKKAVLNKSSNAKYSIMAINIGGRNKKQTIIGEDCALLLYGANMDNLHVGDELYLV